MRPLLIGGYARTAEAQLLVDSGWAHAITATRAVVRAGAPRITPTGDDFELERDPAAVRARLPSLALRTARAALAVGRPVLVQVPRAGYAPSLACARDRTPARCSFCSGPLAAAGPGGMARCRWCARPATDWACPVCGGRALRAVVVGARRTAEELGRAFPGARVRTSGGDAVLDRVDGGAELVVATPGAEPVAAGGYGAALLLDGWTLLSRADLRAGEEALRDGSTPPPSSRADGQVVIAADAGVAAVQALVRWDPVGHAARELADRTELGFPPATRMASITGPAPAIQGLLAVAELPPSADRIGPVELDRPHRPGDPPPQPTGRLRGGRAAAAHPGTPWRRPRAGPGPACGRRRAIGPQGSRSAAHRARPRHPGLSRGSALPNGTARIGTALHATTS